MAAGSSSSERLSADSGFMAAILATQAWLSPRLADLAAAAAAELPAGIADRAAVLTEDLATRPALPIRRIRLIDSREVHSAGWRRLLGRLEECGVAVEQIPVEPAAPGAASAWLSNPGNPGG